MAWVYGARIARDGPDFVASVRDLPEVCTAGATRQEARDLAIDAVDAIVAHRIEKGLDAPPPSALRRGEIAVRLPLLMQVKAELYVAWRRSGLSKRELARRLGLRETEARRILDPRHRTATDTMDRAAEALGATINIAHSAA